MLKVISLLKRKEDITLEDFRQWALNEHPKLGQKMPGLLHYRMSVVLDDNPALPADAVSEMWFADMAARNTAFGTDEGKAAAADAIAHCSSRTHLLTEEKVLVS